MGRDVTASGRVDEWQTSIAGGLPELPTLEPLVDHAPQPRGCEEEEPARRLGQFFEPQHPDRSGLKKVLRFDPLRSHELNRVC